MFFWKILTFEKSLFRIHVFKLTSTHAIAAYDERGRFTRIRSAIRMEEKFPIQRIENENDHRDRLSRSSVRSVYSALSLAFVELLHLHVRIEIVLSQFRPTAIVKLPQTFALFPTFVQNLTGVTKLKIINARLIAIEMYTTHLCVFDEKQ